MEVVFLVARQAMALAQECRDLFLHLVDLLRVRRLQADGLHVGDAHHALLGRRQRDVDDIVLVLAEAGTSLRCQDADDLERLVLDANVLADRVLRAEQVLRDRRADDSHARALRHVVLADERAVADSQRADLHEFRRHARDGRIPVLVAVDDLVRGADCRGHVADILDLRRNGLGVIVLERLHRAGRTARAAAVRGARHDRDGVGAEALEVRGDARAHAHANGDERDDGGDADDDAEHRQERAHLVRKERMDGHDKAFLKQHP